MAESTLIDYNFGRTGNTSKTYINNEIFRGIDFIYGWEDANTKERNNTSAKESATSIVKGKGNYLRTCLEHNFLQNTVNSRGNMFPYCFSDDSNITDVPATARYWPKLPRFTTDGKPSASGALVGFQHYICPKKTGANWPSDYYTLTKTKSNSNWPLRPSNGEGATITYSPAKPYWARIRVKLTDLKWVTIEQTTQTRIVRNILEDDTVSESSDSRLNGEIVELTKVRGFITLSNPNGINGSTNESDQYTWSHSNTQIVYRVTNDEFGGDEETPTITVFNSEWANTTVNEYGQSVFGGGSIAFEVPVLSQQKYLVFDIYTDVCDLQSSQTSANTIWWQLKWAFESCYYRNISTSGNDPLFYVETNGAINRTSKTTSEWPKTQYYYSWVITHNLGTDNLSVTVYDKTKNNTQVFMDVRTIDANSCELLIKSNLYSEESTGYITAGRFKAFIIAGKFDKGVNSDL